LEESSCTWERNIWVIRNKWPKLPEDLFVLLWILRFGIHDDHSLSTTALFFSPDCMKTPSDSVDYIYTLYWLKTNIIHPAMQVYNLFENDCDTLKIFDEYYMGGDSIRKCNKESILTNLLSQMIEILVQKGYPVLFPTKNANTIAIENQINFMNKQSQGNQFYILTVFFRPIEHIIEKKVKEYHHIIFQHFYKKKDFVGEKGWPLLKQHNAKKKRKQGENKKYSVLLSHITQVFKILHCCYL